MTSKPPQRTGAPTAAPAAQVPPKDNPFSFYAFDESVNKFPDIAEEAPKDNSGDRFSVQFLCTYVRSNFVAQNPFSFFTGDLSDEEDTVGLL